MGETENQSLKPHAFKKVRVNGVGAPEEVHYHLLHEGVPSEFEKYAETELNETAANVAKGMQSLKKFLQDKHITDVDDNNLRYVLRACKYDRKKSVAKLENFLKGRNFLLEKVAELDLKKVEYILKDKCFAFLPYRDKFGRGIFYTQATVNFDFYDVDDACICFNAMLLYLMTYPMTSLFGYVYIVESRSPSLSTFYRILMAYKRYIRLAFSMPVRLQKLDIINENFLTRWFANVTRPIVPSKIYQRISFHGTDLGSLQEFYHPDILTEECGGNLGPTDNDFYKEGFIDFLKKLKVEHRRKVTVQNKSY